MIARTLGLLMFGMVEYFTDNLKTQVMDFIKTREKLAKEINIHVKSSNEKEALAQSRNGYEKVRGEMFGILPVFDT
ncbi:hypothetical protein ABES08_21500 [Peribacillus simplex]|uniref:hypothetical protein n=1 Tax=Peribacillus TaxID=2675229 RepID=UPI002953FB14|nr:hypothetical protein [Peribacillus sp. CSMR9]